MFKGLEDFQKVGKTNFDATVQSVGQINKGFQAIAAEVTGYTRKTFEEGTAHVEQMLGAKSVEQVMELQASYARKAYDDYVAQLTKLSDMYADVAKDAYKPVEAAFSKNA